MKYVIEGEDCTLEQWLEKLNKNIVLIFHHLDLFKKLWQIIKNNPNFKDKDVTLIEWMRESFTEDLVISIGKICDPDKRKQTYSLVRFLNALKEPCNSHYLSRKRYVRLRLSHVPEEEISLKKHILTLANKEFDSLAITGQNSFSTDTILADISRLIEDDPLKKIIKWRDTVMAHMDRKKLKLSITYEELFNTFDIIEEIVKKYNWLVLLTNGELVPVMQGNWKAVLTFPWIRKNNKPDN